MSVTETAALRPSICICTRNRPDELRRALASVVTSNPAAHQIVVADDSDDDATESLVAATDAEITYVRGPRAGLGANRNAAVAVADGDFLLFLDDDGLLGDEFMARMERRFEALPPERRGWTILAGTGIEHGRVVVPNEQGFLGFQSRPYRAGEPLRTVAINATLFPRELFDRVRFDPGIVYGFDEVDFTTQAVAAGFEILPCFDASNLHLPSEIGRQDYGEAATAARLYVTLKRRRWTERSPARAWLGFAAAATHVELASIRRLGPRAGVVAANRAVASALSDYRTYTRNRARAAGSTG
jgi:glycosyltransferase involved in cell wall biosynthesis